MKIFACKMFRIGDISRGLWTLVALSHVVVVTQINFVKGMRDPPLLLLVLFDGFRWDYMDKIETPNFHFLARNGVRAKHVMNVVPTVTMANHYTIITGVYPETHGIVANNFYDPVLHEAYHMMTSSAQTDPRWFDTGVEPLWVSNQNYSSGRYSGSMLWPDTLAPVKGISPTYQTGPPLFDESISDWTRIDTVIDWFLNPERPINLGMLYFNEPDETGHAKGPNSVEIQKVVTQLDSKLGYLLSRLKQEQLLDKMNIVITADHGMTEVLPENYIDLNEFLDPSLYDDYQLYSMGLFNPYYGKEDEVYDKLKNLTQYYPQAQVYRRTDEYMKSLNYSNNVRISPIIVPLEKSWYFTKGEKEKKYQISGAHGYLPSVEDMHPFFIGHGPRFKTGYETDMVYNIDFYELMCHLLEVNPAPNNGSLNNIKHILKDVGAGTSVTDATDYTLATYFFVALFCALVAGVFTIGAVRQRRMRNRVISLEDITLFQMNSKIQNHEHKVPLLEDEDFDEEQTFDL